MSQTSSELPYAELPDHPKRYTANTVVSRFIDGLGYRYYWATKDLREEDLNYTPSPNARNQFETLVHIYGLSKTMLNAVVKNPNQAINSKELQTYEGLRKATLLNLKQTSEIHTKATEGAIEDFNIVFNRNGTTTTYPFWYMMNGPLADAMYHLGQVVTLRRSSGNPINPKVNVFLGTLPN